MASPAQCRRCGAALAENGTCPACAIGTLLDPRDNLVGLIPESWELPEVLRFVDEYLVYDLLGAGGMGEVFRARSVHSHQFVALKLLQPSVHPQRSDLEIRTLAEASHPGIVRFLRRGRLGDREWYAMELVEGVHLGTLSRPGSPLAPHRAADYVAEAADALEFLHTFAARASREPGAVAVGGPILHRDLKPSNLLLDAFGRIKVIDFGLAKRLEGPAGITLEDQFLGTPEYAAPEQVDRRLGRETVRTDVYGLGATLYQLLTGHPPQAAASKAQVLVLIQTQDPAPPRRHQPALDADLEAICLRCLARRPEERYATAAEVAADLRRWRRGEPTLARPAGPLRRVAKWTRRRPVAAGALAVILFVLLAGSARELANRHARDEAEVRLALGQSQQAVIQGDTLRALARLGTALRQHPDSPPLAQKVAHLIRHASLWIPEATVDVPGAGELVLPEELKTDASRQWFGVDREVRFLDASSSAATNSAVTFAHPLTQIAVSPEADLVVAASDSEWVVARASTGEILQRQEHSLGPITSLRILRDDRFLLGGLHGLECRTATTGSVRWRRPMEEGGLLAITESTAHDLVVGLSVAAAVHVGRLSTGEALPQVGVTLSGVPRAAAISPDGSRLWIATHDGWLRFWNLGADGLTAAAQIRLTAGPVRSGAASADGRWIAIAGDGANGDDTGYLQLWSTDGSERSVPAWQVSLAHASGDRVRFSGDASRLVAAVISASGAWSMHTFQTADGNPASAPIPLSQPIQGLALDPSGTRLTALLEATPTASPRQVAWFFKDSEVLPKSSIHSPAIESARAAVRPSFLSAAEAQESVWNVSPAGRRVAVARNGHVRIFDAGSGRTLALLEHSSAVSTLAFDREERRLVAGTAERELHLWDLATEQEIAAPWRSDLPVTDVGFSTDGEQYGTPTMTAPCVQVPTATTIHLAELALALAAARTELELGDFRAAEATWRSLEGSFPGRSRRQILQALVAGPHPPAPAPR